MNPCPGPRARAYCILPPATSATRIATNACQRTNFPWTAPAAAASMTTSEGIGIGTPIDLISITAKIAVRPYNARTVVSESVMFWLSARLDRGGTAHCPDGQGQTHRDVPPSKAHEGK